MKKNLYALVVISFIFCMLPEEGISQENLNLSDTSRKGAVKIFIDCESCDMNYIRLQIPYVNYVRDVREAHLYILVTQQNAGSGGEQFTFTFQGQGEYNGMNDTLSYTSNPDETSTIVRERKTNILKMGLMRYVVRTPVFKEIQITHNSELEQEQVTDKWNNWVFELSTEPKYRSEEANKRLELRNSINVTKITPDIKLEIELDHFYNRESFIDETETGSTKNTYTTSEISMDNLFVKSLGDHWSGGVKLNVGASTRENYDFKTEVLPSIEYDIYPYSESTHRQLRFLYSIGYQYNNYIDSTIYNKVDENLAKQVLNIAYQVQKKWGSVNLAIIGSNYFNDFSKNRLELLTAIRVRIVKGLTVEISGGVAYINDQLNLKMGDVTEAERLLQLRELSTSYLVEGGVGLTYTFGSIYNNVVNPRFGSGGGIHFD
jgi:hypothetical protein